MTLVNLRGLVALLGGTGQLRRGTIEATYWDARGPHVQVAGEGITFPRTFTIEIIDGIPVEPIELTPTDGRHGVSWVVKDDIVGHRLERFTEIPNVPEVDFGDLVDVDPRTFQPSASAVAAWVAAIAEVAAIRNDVLARTLTATPDPNDPGVLILTFPTFMAHPDGSSVLIPIEET